ncbi:MAG TPA: bifunctional (p)ppGpp synthetase/guanosine-3',5'-bis(diphosphate) 3'-pyrophosphohydrolase, partial [Thermoanaerobaculia bacterium]
MPLSKSFPPPVPTPGVARFEDILDCLSKQGRATDPEFLRGVYDFSAEMHKDQVRRSGEPYMIHPLNVAWLLADLKFDQTCVAVGLLHDVLEDTLTTREALQKEFGAEVTDLVDGVTKIGRHEYVRRDEAQAETFRKMILASAKDIRVIVVKLADRLHNMQTLQHLQAEARRRISRETLEIYSPIAHRLGMARVKGDLEDLAFYHLYPHNFAELHNKIAEKMKVGQGGTDRIRDRLARSLEAAAIDAEISFRVKRYYSIFEKLRRQGIDISQLYDFLAFRIITANLKDTYAALGVVHQNWRPIPGRFKDYIAMPKPNLYQSLHTTVVGDQGQPFEVQIRTREMDLVAEEGIAAHWRYKGGKVSTKASDPNILWLRQLLEWQKEVQDPRTFLTTLKVDLYPDEVYAFTPKGEVFSFPRGATPLDFAYRVHTDLGHHCAGARVNGKLVPLRTSLQNGDMVEVLTNPSRNPSRDWLNLVVTSRAKSKIRQWLNTQQKQRAMEIGRRLFEKEIRKYGLSIKKVTDSPGFTELLHSEGLAKIDDLYSRIGFGKTESRHVLERALGQEKLPEVQEKPSRIRQAVSRILPFGAGGMSGPITVKGQGDLLAYLAKCCTPLPGEDIVGYVTRGRGVSVHRVDCPNVQNLLYNPEREIEVKWEQGKSDVYQVSLTIEVEDQQGMLARLTEAITRAGSNITSIEADTFKETGLGSIGVVCQLRDRKQ